MKLLAGLQAGPRGGRGRERVFEHRMSLRCMKFVLHAIVLNQLRAHIAAHIVAACNFCCIQFLLHKVLLHAVVSADSFAAKQLV